MSRSLTEITDNMISWAMAHLGEEGYAGWCLSFIEDALEISNDIEIFGGDSAKESSEMYRDALRVGLPEKGAFVFYDCLCQGEDGPVNWGHCGIALDDGQVIHAWNQVRIDDYLEMEKLTALSGDHPRYVGWVPVTRVLVEKDPNAKTKKAVLYIHGKNGSADEAEHYRSLFPDADVIGVDYRATTPWEAAEEFPQIYAARLTDYDEVTVIANSIGAFFCMSAPADSRIKRAFFISPIVNMEKLITDMMQWAGVSEEQLREKQEISTPFGETLSWRYLCYVREHTVSWPVDTHILYGSRDNLTALPTVTEFAERCGASLTVMDGGEHWFHTPEQMAFLDTWMTRLL